jgi:RNA polymerase sigma-70 factor (ECF subfamily)
MIGRLTRQTVARSNGRGHAERRAGESIGADWNFQRRAGSKFDILEEVISGSATLGDFSVKQARVVGWSEVGGREAVLIERCTAGDDAAYAELVEEHQRMVVQLAVNLLGDRDEAMDLSQEVFLRVFRTISRFRGQSSLRTWIYRIAVNQARNRHRFWRRRHRADQVSLDAHVAAHGELLSTGNTGPDRLLAQKELASRLERALDHLPFDQRTAIVLREVDGLSYEEIAFSLGVAVGTVKSRLTRARQALRLELREVRSA